LRKGGDKGKGRTAKISRGALTGNLRAHIVEIEDVVRHLEKRIQFLELTVGIPPIIKEVPGKPGPEPKINDEDLFDNREQLIDWLERWWRYLAPKFNRATGAKDILDSLKICAGPEKKHSYYVKLLLNNVEVLWKFLRSRRYHRKPSARAVTDALTRPYGDVRRMKGAAKLPTRQIANAMAGVPRIEWRTSLDRCAKNPSRQVVGNRTAEHYRKLYKVGFPE
jgi:hypothetical protein